MTEFYIKNHKKQPLRGKRAVKKKEKKGRLKGTLKKPPLNKKRAPQKKKNPGKCPFFLTQKKVALDSNMPKEKPRKIAKFLGGQKYLKTNVIFFAKKNL